MARDYGEIVHLPLGSKSSYLLSHPQYIKHVLQDNYRNYRQSPRTKKFKAVLGDGLLTSEGNHWLQQRRLIQPAFHHRRLSTTASTVTDTVAAMLERWKSVAVQDKMLEMTQEMTRLTREVIVKTMFGTKLEEQKDLFVHQALLDVSEYLNHRMWDFMNIPQWFTLLKHRHFQKALHTLDQIIYDIIGQRQHSGEDAGDLLSILLQACDAETGRPMTDKQLRDEVMTIFRSGHETLASALTWTWYLLSQNPEIENKLHAELDRVLNGRLPTFQDLPNLTYTGRVIEEVLRLYPPAWMISRTAIEDDEIGGYHIPANSMILISSYVMHRHPDFWETPTAFDPEHFTPSQTNNRPRYAYLPFGGGARICIGKDFAMMEAKLIVATVAQHYKPRPATNYKAKPHVLVILRPQHDLPMKLEPLSG
jgi:cytochrome P450